MLSSLLPMLNLAYRYLLLWALLGFVPNLVAAQPVAAPTYLTADPNNNPQSPAGFTELTIPSHGSRLAAFMYTAQGKQPHPTLILLHGFPGNERNLDLAQAVRRTGWNVLYFDYRGSWGSEGDFSFANCVEDVASVAAFCKSQATVLHIDTTRLALFGHSMGGWVALKALPRLPGIKKAVIISPWDIYASATAATPADSREANEKYFMLHIPAGQSLLAPVVIDPRAYQLTTDGPALNSRQLVFLDENRRNEAWIKPIGAANKASFRYEVWATDHPFSNKRIALTKTVIAFLRK